MIPKPCAWGELKHRSAPTFFYLSDYLELVSQMPDPKQLARELANLHRINQSRTTHFGFQLPTFDGRLPQETTWDP